MSAEPAAQPKEKRMPSTMADRARRFARLCAKAGGLSLRQEPGLALLFQKFAEHEIAIHEHRKAATPHCEGCGLQTETLQETADGVDLCPDCWEAVPIGAGHED